MRQRTAKRKKDRGERIVEATLPNHQPPILASSLFFSSSRADPVFAVIAHLLFQFFALLPLASALVRCHRYHISRSLVSGFIAGALIATRSPTFYRAPFVLLFTFLPLFSSHSWRSCLPSLVAAGSALFLTRYGFHLSAKPCVQLHAPVRPEESTKPATASPQHPLLLAH
jgi:hypothetical protein